MTLRLTFGVDPGLSGAIVTLVDGEPGPMLDMPLALRGERNEVDGPRIAQFVREQRARNPGAFAISCIEQVGAAPMEGRKQGASSMFRFGDGFGAVRTALACTGLPVIRVVPVVWKRHFSLTGCTKDESRTRAILRFPSVEPMLRRKKDCGRADALWLALWCDQTEQAGRAAA